MPNKIRCYLHHCRLPHYPLLLLRLRLLLFKQQTNVILIKGTLYTGEKFVA